MASVTGSIARGFLDGSTSPAVRSIVPATSVAAPPTGSTGTATTSSTRLSGADLHLGGTTVFGRTEVGGGSDLFANLRSALAGFDAQAGFDQRLVAQLIGVR